MEQGMIETFAGYGWHKERLSKKELITKYMSESSCTVWAPPGTRLLEIKFMGEAARIPSLKNWKIPGKNFTNPDVDARLTVMHRLVEGYCAANGVTLPQYGDEEVFVLLLCANRSRRFDVDNCLSSVKDYLEPRFKNFKGTKRDRGWGLGLLNNDEQITAFAKKAEGRDQSIIWVRPLDQVQGAISDFCCNVY